jgi:hypothetical protein
MASGPNPTDGWNELIKQLNIEFGDQNRRKQLAQDFKVKHGKKGDGKGASADLTPYKFGRYLDKSNTLLPSTNKKAQFSIDAGTRHWDDSLKLLEHAIRRSLIRETGGSDDPTEITFVPGYNPSSTKARAVIKDGNTELTTADAINAVVDRGGKLTIEITCPTANLRPSP